MTATLQTTDANASGRALAVRCEGIEKSFSAGESRIRVLRGTDFVAESGKMNFLVGPSGCGKTTLISVIGGILSCEEGEIDVLGHDLRTMRNGRLADFRLNNLGFIFQQFNLLPALNAEENASLPLVARGESNGRAEKTARELLQRLGLDGQTKKMPSQLSGGQQQRVAIARALVHEPKLIICDEPTASLDAASGHTVMELLRDVALEGDRSVIVVTHDNRIFEFADRISRMADGQITRTETGEEADPA
ncbi:MAG: ABC transporter ATP-binding protein [Planctomycetota bacterium]